MSKDAVLLGIVIVAGSVMGGILANLVTDMQFFGVVACTVVMQVATAMRGVK